ncbi:RNase H-like domain found in reverse transcriptase [Popillia japonica]|uniref:RNase H-like domain found in reverse transcriptase n=1 Tax=Popillia japonica TaxID=7064 RepID=A0AAW1LB38_POPJA
MCADLHNLTRKNTKWNWKHNEDIIFKQVKEAILNANALVPYDANKRLYLACDASEKGIGGLLFHMNDEGEEEPIAFASRVLNDAEKNYSLLPTIVSREDTNVEKQWSPAKVIDRTNKYSYKVVTNDRVERRHADHIRERNDDLPLIDEPVVIDTSELLSTEVPNENQEKSEITIDEPVVIDTSELLSTEVPNENQEKSEITTPQNLEPEINDFSIVSVPGTTTSQTETTQLRRSTRIRTIPRRYPE